MGHFSSSSHFLINYTCFNIRFDKLIYLNQNSLSCIRMHPCSPQLISGPDEYLNPSNPYSYAQSLFRIRQSEEQHELLNSLVLSNYPLSAIETSFLKQTSWQFPYITRLVCWLKLSKAATLEC